MLMSLASESTEASSLSIPKRSFSVLPDGVGTEVVETDGAGVLAGDTCVWVGETVVLVDCSACSSACLSPTQPETDAAITSTIKRYIALIQITF